MTAAIPFPFSVDFSAPSSTNKNSESASTTINLSEHEKTIHEAKQKAHAQGFAEGQQTAETEAAKRVAETTEKIAKTVETIFNALDKDRLQIEKNACTLAYEIASTLAPALIAQQPEGEIIELLTNCLGPLRRTSHLVVRLNETEVPSLRQIIDDLAREKGFEGRLVIMGEDNIKEGDCRIEWADGGIIRDSTRTHEEITSTIEHYIEAQTKQLDPSAMTPAPPQPDNGD